MISVLNHSFKAPVERLALSGFAVSQACNFGSCRESIVLEYFSEESDRTSPGRAIVSKVIAPQ